MNVHCLSRLPGVDLLRYVSADTLSFAALVILKELEVLNELPCYQIQSFRGLVMMLLSLIVICTKTSEKAYDLNRMDYKNIFWTNVSYFVASGMILHSSLCMSLSETISLYLTYPILTRFMIAFRRELKLTKKDVAALIVCIFAIILVFAQDSIGVISQAHYHSSDSPAADAAASKKMEEMGKGSYILPLIAAFATACKHSMEFDQSEREYPPVISALGIGILLACLSPPISMGYQGSKLFDMPAIILCAIAALLTWFSVILRGKTKNMYRNTDPTGSSAIFCVPFALLVDVFYFQTGFKFGNCLLASLIALAVVLLSKSSPTSSRSFSEYEKASDSCMSV
eukprot:CAMPEP_0115020394 /NCGR_PEP_ID=MMETSP0216-20121206/30091_1 /TAXON_ID=223996 /ORGANISM="Protocruzia adherens, Strain Boccale" /LENGTH=340 /DNA_ID=CAMNT_0002392203 /DNA_START=143 /DNA_END=1165 /DNA_ORIENTATION=+